MAGSDRTEQFVQLITQYQQRVHLFILSLVPNRADAEEILQETNLVLWRKFDEFRPGSDFRAWAFQVAYNKVKSFRERHGRERLPGQCLSNEGRLRPSDCRLHRGHSARTGRCHSV